MENCKNVWEKIREKSGNFEVDDKWQPCSLIHACRTLIPKYYLLLNGLVVIMQIMVGKQCFAILYFNNYTICDGLY